MNFHRLISIFTNQKSLEPELFNLMTVTQRTSHVIWVLLVIVGFASCDENFTNLDTDLIDQNYSTPDTVFSVRAYSRFVGPVQTNNQLSYKLGYYNDPLYGPHSADFLTQVVLSANNPAFSVDTLNPVLEKVILTLPYYSTTELDDEDNTVYNLDSIFGGDPIKLSVYESNYFLRDFDPATGFADPQQYFSNERQTFIDQLGTLLVEVPEYVASDEADEFIIEDLDTLSFEPGINLELPLAFFQEKIWDQQNEEVLLNNNNFKDYFRGLYFKVESVNDSGHQAIFDPTQGKISMYYSAETSTFDDSGNQSTDDEGEIIREVFSYDLNFSAIKVNIFDHQWSAAVVDDVASGDSIQGAETLYIAGNDGIATIIELFGNDENQNGLDDLQELRDEGWLVNEANLIFYVDQDKVSTPSQEPERILVFDTKNSGILADYSIDLTSNLTPIDAITNHLGRLVRGSDDRGEYYKIKLTAHVSNLINRDSTNVSLGLVVSQNVSYVGFFDIQEPLLEDGFDRIPGGAIVAPQGTALHGNLATDPEKRLRLELYYTKPE